MRSRRRGWPVIVLALLVALSAGCGNDDDDDANGDAGTTTTAEATTTSDVEATTTTGDSPTTTTTLPDEPPLRDDAASGSGCEPGSGELPDGWWYGVLEGDVGDDVTFDLACYYIGAAAEAEAASRGDEVNDDYYVVNENPQLRTVPVADAASVTCVDMPMSGVRMVECGPDDVAGDFALWLRVHNGEVDRIVEQYAP